MKDDYEVQFSLKQVHVNTDLKQKVKAKTSEGGRALQPARIFINLENDETISDEWEPVKTDKKVSLEKQKLVEAQAKQFLAKAKVSKCEVKHKLN